MKVVAIVVALFIAALAPTYAITLDEIVAKHLQAKGGEQALRAASTVVIRASMTIHQAGIDANMTIMYKRPNLFRATTSMQGMEMIQAFDGTQVWYTNPMSGKVETAAADQAESIMQQADIGGPLINYKDKGYDVKLVGSVDVEGTTAYKLELMRNGTQAMVLYIDAVTFQDIRMESTASMMGQTVSTDIRRSDYRIVNGVSLPYKIETYMMGMLMTTADVESVEINTAVEASMFARPAQK